MFLILHGGLRRLFKMLFHRHRCLSAVPPPYQPRHGLHLVVSLSRLCVRLCRQTVKSGKSGL